MDGLTDSCETSWNPYFSYVYDENNLTNSQSSTGGYSDCLN